MTYLKWSLTGLVPMMLVALWLFTRSADDSEALKGFCQSTRGGEPWSHTLERAHERGFDVVPGNDSRSARREYLLINNRLGATMGCRITVEQGRVVETRTGQTPISSFPRE